MELQGQVVVIGQTETFGAKGFKKRQIFIKTDAQYPQTIPVDFTQDKCGILDKYSVGQIVKISVNVQGSEWQGKYYVNLNGWKIENGEREKSANSFMPDRDAQMEPTTNEPEDDGLPF
jgi:hypothetical protein